MGNNQPQKGKQANKKQISVITHDKQIVLHYSYKLKLVIAYASTFPHNFEGLKLWDSNIVLARYIIMNTHKFKNMNVLEIPSGTGIAGITLRKWTSANKVILADISPEMIQNIRNNMQKNSIQNVVAVTMQWNQYGNFNTKYNIILSCDPFFHKCVPNTLFQIFNHFIDTNDNNGMLILAAPKSHKLNQFIKIVESRECIVTKQKINSQQYFSSPLFNQVQGEKDFPQLSKGQVGIYQIRRKLKQAKQKNSQTQVKHRNPKEIQQRPKDTEKEKQQQKLHQQQQLKGQKHTQKQLQKQTESQIINNRKNGRIEQILQTNHGKGGSESKQDSSHIETNREKQKGKDEQQVESGQMKTQIDQNMGGTVQIGQEISNEHIGRGEQKGKTQIFEQHRQDVDQRQQEKNRQQQEQKSQRIVTQEVDQKNNDSNQINDNVNDGSNSVQAQYQMRNVQPKINQIIQSQNREQAQGPSTIISNNDGPQNNSQIQNREQTTQLIQQCRQQGIQPSRQQLTRQQATQLQPSKQQPSRQQAILSVPRTTQQNNHQQQIETQNQQQKIQDIQLNIPDGSAVQPEILTHQNISADINNTGGHSTYPKDATDDIQKQQTAASTVKQLIQGKHQQKEEMKQQVQAEKQEAKQELKQDDKQEGGQGQAQSQVKKNNQIKKKKKKKR